MGLGFNHLQQYCDRTVPIGIKRRAASAPALPSPTPCGHLRRVHFPASDVRPGTHNW